MLAARVLTDHFERVTIIERDHLPELFQKKLRGYLIGSASPGRVLCAPRARECRNVFRNK